MKHIKLMIVLLGMTSALVWASCKKQDEWKKYLPEQPKVYPGMAEAITTYPGNNRIKLSWLLVSDPTITRVTVFWNNGHDSASVAVNRQQGVDTVSIIIDKLQETSYTFSVFTYDKEGNKSVPAYVTGRVYGPKYQSTLLNRALLSVNYSGDSKLLTINWGTADTVNVGTQLWYTDEAGIDQTLLIDATTFSTIIPWKVGTKIWYQSAYKPSAKAIDTFTVNNKDSISVKNVPVPKAAWTKVDLPNDVAGNAWGTNLSWIWDGKGADYPQIYHTGGEGIPHHFTIDLGALYDLTKFENIGRVNSNPYHNPTKFEVWGIADITNAATTLPGSDPGWKNESIAKGWTLLQEINRPDNGTAPYKVDLLPGIPKVRYIRIRVLETIDHDPDSHMSEISFWYNP
ncbi:hypothetical protein HB364_30665 [Pseudoflavitalea sp. X16]|uniref:DUF4998 domain-containing protein n=1 Tax=Paraflavitalea devenefica TaxID=2716334 RepID=UPI001422B020|nr:DUF4998 domain-containing protein [Paraflavitalea devenefica]NII29482.1 hypothetical protein [Paraflavitalea devenefica]